MTKNSLLIPFLIGLGLLSLALSILISSNTDSLKPGEAPLARIELNMGKVFILKKNMTQKVVLSKRAALFNLDSIETGPESDATIEFDSLYRIRIEENSLITLDLEGDQTVLIIKRGDVHVENFGREETVFVSRDGVHWNATDYELNYKKQPQSKSLPEVAPIADPTPAPNIYLGLNSETIQETLRLHRGGFFKCYTQLLQKSPGLVGQASISFTIEKSGRVFNAEIASSSITDNAFKKCLIEAIRRVEFKSFAGEAISTVFPLKFE